MVVDASALIAIVLQEPVAARLSRAIASAPIRLVSAGTLLEAGIVALSRGQSAGVRLLDGTIASLDVTAIPVTVEQVALARAAFAEYGKGRHPAALNFGDCFSYALAKERGEPLLFIGHDFSQTDLDAAPY